MTNSDLVLRMEWRLNETLSIKREIIKITRLACRAGQTNKIREMSLRGVYKVGNRLN